MAQNLEEVLQQLQTALTGLNTFLETQNRQMETNTKNDTGANMEPQTPDSQLQGLAEWIEAHTFNKARLLKLRNEFINHIQLASSSYSPDKNILRSSVGSKSGPIRDRLTDEQVRIIEGIWPKQIANPQEMLYGSDSSGYPVLYKDEDKLAPGRIIIIHIDHRDKMVDITTLVHLYNWLEINSPFLTERFVLNFVHEWRFVSLGEGTTSVGGCQITYHLNCCQRNKDRDFDNSNQSSIDNLGLNPHDTGIPIRRQHAAMGGLVFARGVHFYEKRWSLCIGMVQLSNTIAYSLLVFDGGESSATPVLDKKMLQEHGIAPCGKAVGIAQFQAMICVILNDWKTNWTNVLDAIDRAMSIEFHDTLDDWKLDNLMFDESFKRSKRYFIVLQLLRIINTWVEKSVADLNALRETWHQVRNQSNFNFNSEELRNLEENWDKVFLSRDLQATRLIDRVNRKTEEVKSLRDGLFNATSLREANKGMALNRAIYIFTIITVIYTPVGFMATFWALPVMNSSSGDDSRPSLIAFISTFVAIPVLTYIIVLMVIGYLSFETPKRKIDHARAEMRFAYRVSVRYARHLEQVTRKILVRNRHVAPQTAEAA